MSIVSGAIAERMKLWVFLSFAIVMSAIIYPIGGSWGWGSTEVLGLFSFESIGFKDFAGSGIVHMVGACAALAGVLLLGPRIGKYSKEGHARAIPGANIPLADRKSTRLNSSHVRISYAVFCLKKKKKKKKAYY